MESPGFKLSLNVRQTDGSKKMVDIRTLGFVRFEGNPARINTPHESTLVLNHLIFFLRVFVPSWFNFFNSNSRVGREEALILLRQ